MYLYDSSHRLVKLAMQFLLHSKTVILTFQIILLPSFQLIRCLQLLFTVSSPVSDHVMLLFRVVSFKFYHCFHVCRNVLQGLIKRQFSRECHII